MVGKGSDCEQGGRSVDGFRGSLGRVEAERETMSQASSLQLEVVEMPAGAPVEIRSRSACSRPIDGAAGVSVRIHLIHRLRFCSVKLSTQLQSYNNNGRRLQRLSPAQQCCVCWSSLRGCGLIHDPPHCPRCRISSSAFPLSSPMNFELSL